MPVIDLVPVKVLRPEGAIGRQELGVLPTHRTLARMRRIDLLGPGHARDELVADDRFCDELVEPSIAQQRDDELAIMDANPFPHDLRLIRRGRWCGGCRWWGA